MARLTDFWKSFVSPTDEIQTPSFIKAECSTHKLVSAPETTDRDASDSNLPEAVVQEKLTSREELPPMNKLSNEAQSDKIDVPVYQSDSEWDVVQRSINLFAEHADLSLEVREAFVKKWVIELEKAEQTSLYRNEDERDGHLGNKINRANANCSTGLLGTYQAMIHPGRQARMNDELKALQCVEKFDLGIIDRQLSRDFKMDLIIIAIGTIEDQKRAAQNLFQKAQQGQPEADKIYAATKALANRLEMRLNSAIKTAVIKMDTAKYQLNKQSAEPSDSGNSDLPFSPGSHAVKSEYQRNTGKESAKEVAKQKVSESSWVDEQALRLLGTPRS